MKHWQKFVVVGLLTTAVHFFVSLGLMLISFGQTMARFDNPTLPESGGERVLTAVVNVLWQPALFLSETFFSPPRPMLVEWGVVLLSSLLWGFGLTLLGYLLVCRLQP